MVTDPERNLNQGDNHVRTDPDRRPRPRRLGRCLRLERGHPATAGGRLHRVRPAQPAARLPQDAAYLHDYLTQNPALAGQPVVLAAHSYSRAVVTNAAVGDPRVNALVYVNPLIPDLGETIGQLAGAQPGSCLLGNPADIFDSVPYPGKAGRGRQPCPSRPASFPAALPPG